MSDTSLKLEELFAEYTLNNTKFVEKGNNSAGLRARKALLEIAKLCKVRRAEIQEVRNNKED